MPWSHHSHSGQFCGHAANTLEEVIQNAIQKGMTTMCLTEHIHRERQDFYPEEEKYHTPASLEELYDAFYHEAHRLQSVYASQIEIFVGFEGEWIRPMSLTIMQQLLRKYPVDLFIGSVHHVHTIPIDYDTPLYHDARAGAGGSDGQIFEEYFDAQLEMLQASRPPVVGHFDLIRLKSDEPDRSFRTWPAVWDKIIRNLKFVAEYDGILELNSSSLRKGMSEAYPQVEICRVRPVHMFFVISVDVLMKMQEFHQLGGRFTLSDDSHGIDQVGLNYAKVIDCVDRAGIKQLYHLSPIPASDVPKDPRFPKVCWRSVDVTDLKSHGFWTRVT